MDHDLIRYPLFQCFEDLGVHRADDRTTPIASERNLVALLFGNNGAVAVDASLPVRNHGEMQGFGRHGFIVAAAALGAI